MENQSQQHRSQVSSQYQKTVGPQLSLDKHNLCMMTIVDNIKQDSVTVTNTGSTTVTYEWKKNFRGDYIPSKKSDFVQRFYCHYPKSIMKPGEQRTFTFSFRSTKPGMFFEEWELIPEPQLLEPLPIISISGMATKEDDFGEKREQIVEDIEKKIVRSSSQEILQDIVDNVKSPPKQRPDINDPVVFKEKFESTNQHLGLYFTQSTMDQFNQLLEDVRERLSCQESFTREDALTCEWDTSVDFIEDLIEEVENPYTKETLMNKYIQVLYGAKKTPTDKAQSYGIFRELVQELCVNTISIDTQVREELQMVESNDFLVPDEDQTEEDREKLKQENANRKLEWLKKNKRKPKTEEEDTQDTTMLLQKTSASLSQNLSDQGSIKAEAEIELMKTKWLIDNHIVLDSKMWDQLNRKESILDIDISGKDVILRIDLDLPLTPFEPKDEKDQENTQEEVMRQQSQSQIQKSSGRQKTRQKDGAQQDETSSLPIQKEELWKQRQIQDLTLIKQAVPLFQYLQEHMVNRTYIIGNLGEKHGRVLPQNSMRIVHQALQNHLPEQQFMFVPDCQLKDFRQRYENEEFPENTIFVMENLNFKPDEFGYVEPEVEKVEEEVKEEPVKEEPVDPKLLKKQQKEEKNTGSQKNRANDDDKKGDETTSKKIEQEEKEQLSLTEEQKQQMEKELQKKKELEHFDQKTIHVFKKNLGQYGSIYINDAPLATLTNSNTIAEIASKKKVMGLKMSSEIRKLAQFFLKQYPFDINLRWKKQPEQREYFTYKGMTLLGGQCLTVQDILDKCLMANSMIDQSQQIFFAGEVALAAIHALGISVGKVERSETNKEEYDSLKFFFQKVFEKAYERGVAIILPVDFVVSKKIDFTPVQEPEPTQAVANQEKSKQQTEKSQKSQEKNSATGQESQEKKEPEIKEPTRVFKPQHWTDAQIHNGQSKIIDLEQLINIKMGEIAQKVNQKNNMGETQNMGSTNMDKQNIENTLASQENLAVSRKSANQSRGSAKNTNEDNAIQSQDGGEDVVMEQEKIEDDDYVIQYGPKSINQLKDSVNKSFKCFWDGSISLYKEHALASENNKEFLQALLEMRDRTNGDEEPPVTLLHSYETEQVLRTSLMRIKVEQQEAQEEEKRRLEQQEDTLIDNEEDNIDVDESKEEISTFQEDLEMIADFIVREATPFTTKLLQGVQIKSLLNFNEHQKQTLEQEEEDLTLLEEI